MKEGGRLEGREAKKEKRLAEEEWNIIFAVIE